VKYSFNPEYYKGFNSFRATDFNFQETVELIVKRLGEIEDNLLRNALRVFLKKEEVFDDEIIKHASFELNDGGKTLFWDDIPVVWISENTFQYIDGKLIVEVKRKFLF
jgi:hypothetical protein